MSTASSSNQRKVYDSAREALSGLSDGASLLIGGFAGHEEPETLIDAVIASGVRALPSSVREREPQARIEST